MSDDRSLRTVAIGALVLLALVVLLVSLFGGVGFVLAVVIAVVVFLWLLPSEITGWKKNGE